MTAPTSQACNSWLTDEDWETSKLQNITADEKVRSGLWASTYAWRVCQRAVGVCTYTRVFCDHHHHGCGQRRSWLVGCSCGPHSRIDLGARPVVSVTSAVISDPEETLDGTAHDLEVIDYRYLVRADGLPWPRRPVTTTVIWDAGVVPDVVDRGAVLALAQEHVKLTRGADCALPEGMAQVRTGNGGTIKMIDPFDIRLQGLPSVAAFYQWALSFFAEGVGGGIMDPADKPSSYEVTFS